MGNCFYPPKSLPANTYSVRVISDGMKLEGQAKGLLQVTDTNIILQMNQRKKIEWPLKYLRSYGCNGHIFSIEAGSKCPSEEGIYYAFNSEHAQELFKAVETIVSNKSAHHNNYSLRS